MTATVSHASHLVPFAVIATDGARATADCTALVPPAAFRIQGEATLCFDGDRTGPAVRVRSGARIEVTLDAPAHGHWAYLDASAPDVAALSNVRLDPTGHAVFTIEVFEAGLSRIEVASTGHFEDGHSRRTEWHCLIVATD
jgi:hypothetical protein